MAATEASPDSSTKTALSPPHTSPQDVEPHDDDCFIVKSYETSENQQKLEDALPPDDNNNNVYVDLTANQHNVLKNKDDQNKGSSSDILTLAPATDLISHNVASSFDLNLDPLIMNSDVGDCFHSDSNLVGMNIGSALPQFQTLVGNNGNPAISVDTRLPLASPPVPFNSYLHDHRSNEGLHTPPPPEVASPTAHLHGHLTRHSPLPNQGIIGQNVDLKPWGGQNLLMDSFDYSNFGHHNQIPGSFGPPREQPFQNLSYRPYEFQPIRPAPPPPPQPSFFPYSRQQLNLRYPCPTLNHPKPYHPVVNSHAVHHYPARVQPPNPLTISHGSYGCPPVVNGLTSALPATVPYQPPSYGNTFGHMGIRPLHVGDFHGGNNWPQNECPIRPAMFRPPKYSQYHSTFTLAPRPEVQDMIGQPSVYALPHTHNPALMNYNQQKPTPVTATKTLRDLRECKIQPCYGVSDGHEMPIVESTTNSPLVEQVDNFEQVHTPMSLQESAGPGSVQSEGMLEPQHTQDSELQKEDLEPSQTGTKNTQMIASPESPDILESDPLKCHNGMDLDCLSPSDGIQGSNLLLSSSTVRAPSGLSDVVLTEIDTLQDFTDNPRITPHDPVMTDLPPSFERPSSSNPVSNIGEVKLPEFKPGKVDPSVHRPRAFDLVQVQIGSFIYDTRGHPAVKYARLKISFVKRILCYELELIKPSTGYETATPFTIIELPFSNISGLEGEGRVLKIKVDAIPFMFLGQRPETEKARMKPVLYNREQPFDLTAGQIQTVPVHKVTLKAPNANKILSHFSLFDERFCVIIKHCRIDDQSTFPAGFQSNVVSSATIQHREMEFPSNEPQPKKKRCQRPHGCSCKTGCRQERCKCVLNRKKCEELCRCENCVNPLNFLEAYGYNLQQILSDLCLVKNVFKMQALKAALKRRVVFPCCHFQAPFYSCFPGLIRCPNYENFQKEYKYSWCSDTLCDEAVLPRNHCAICDRCTGVNDLHCEECNWCYTPSIKKGNRCPRCLTSQLSRVEPVQNLLRVLSPGRLRGSSRPIQGVTSNASNALQETTEQVFSNATPATTNASPDIEFMQAFIQSGGNPPQYIPDTQSPVLESTKPSSTILPATSVSTEIGKETPINEEIMWGTDTEIRNDNNNKDLVLSENTERNAQENEPNVSDMVTESAASPASIDKGDVILAYGTSNSIYHVTATLTMAAVSEVNAWSPMLDSEGLGEPKCASSPLTVCTEKDTPKTEPTTLIKETERAA